MVYCLRFSQEHVSNEPEKRTGNAYDTYTCSDRQSYADTRKWMPGSISQQCWSHKLTPLSIPQQFRSLEKLVRSLQVKNLREEHARPKAYLAWQFALYAKEGKLSKPIPIRPMHRPTMGLSTAQQPLCPTTTPTARRLGRPPELAVPSPDGDLRAPAPRPPLFRSL